jgi:hypothetical protein
MIASYWLTLRKRKYTWISTALHSVCIYVIGFRSFRPGTQKPRQMENAVRDISAEKCVEIKGDYVEK